MLLSATMLGKAWAANVALLIGNNEYSNGIDGLANPINDAKALEAQLKKLDFKTTLVTNANKIDMLEAIDDFSQKIGQDDTILFYYAGHGASAAGNNYLIPSNAQIPKNETWMDEYFIDLDTKIASRLSQSKAKYKIVIMDACRNNPIASMRDMGDRTFVRPDTGKNASGLSFLYSASKGQTAADGRSGNSPFTTALINKLNTPNLTWPELIEDVGQEVGRLTKTQKVWQEGNTLARLVLNQQQKANQQVKENSQDAELTYWESIKNSTNASDYEAYEIDFPKGRFINLAKSRKKQYEVKQSVQSAMYPIPSDSEARKFYDEAIKGNATAQTNLGYMYVTGKGVSQDFSQALYWYRKAIEQNEPYAQTNLGAMYRDGQGVSQDFNQALFWFRKAAEQNQANAQTNLGYMYETGKGVSQDFSQALYWYRKAAEQNEPYAQTNLGDKYRDGQGVSQDFSQAVLWYRKAAEQNQSVAQNNLGVMYRDGKGVSQDFGQALYWYRKAAEQNQANAQTNLGYMYETGKGVNQDFSQAVLWYRKAAEQNNADAQANLGYMYDIGQGVSQDFGQAVYWYRKAAEQNQANAQTNLGDKYREGQGVSQDFNQAVLWYRKAAEKNQAEAQANLGYMYETGKGVNQDFSQAVYWYCKAAEKNQAVAQTNLKRLNETCH